MEYWYGSNQALITALLWIWPYRQSQQGVLLLAQRGAAAAAVQGSIGAVCGRCSGAAVPLLLVLDYYGLFGSVPTSLPLVYRQSRVRVADVQQQPREKKHKSC